VGDVGGRLDLRGLRRTFGTLTALDDLSFEVPGGHVVGFLGPNGAGKTTAMRAIFDLTDLDAGEVLWNGCPVGQAQRRARRKGEAGGAIKNHHIEDIAKVGQHGRDAGEEAIFRGDQIESGAGAVVATGSGTAAIDRALFGPATDASVPPVATPAAIVQLAEVPVEVVPVQVVVAVRPVPLVVHDTSAGIGAPPMPWPQWLAATPAALQSGAPR